MTKLRDDLPPDVRELCEAMLGTAHGEWLCEPLDGSLERAAVRLHAAFQPFLAKPEPKPVIPEWDELTPRQRNDISGSMIVAASNKDIYNAIRKATAKVDE